MSSTCSGLGKCSSEHSTCSSRFCQYNKFWFSIKMYLVIHSVWPLTFSGSVWQCAIMVSLLPRHLSPVGGPTSTFYSGETKIKTKIKTEAPRQRQRQNRGNFVNFLARVDLLLTVLFLFSASQLEVLKRLLFVFSMLMRLYFVFQRPHRDSWLHLQHIRDRLLGA